MAPGDRNPNRRAAPLPQSGTPTSKDERLFEATTVGPAPDEGWSPSPKDKRPPRSDPRLQRKTDVFTENPDVVGAPERTVVAPLPPRRDERGREQPRDERGRDGSRDERGRGWRDARARDADRVRDAGRARDGDRGREAGRAREPDRSRGGQREDRPRSSAKEKSGSGTSPRITELVDRSARSGAHKDRGERNDGRSRAPTPDGAELVHQPTSIERPKHDTPWSRLGVALRDVSHAIVTSSKESWTVLRTQGVKPFVARMKPGAQHAWFKTRDLFNRLRTAAVIKAVELGLVKPKRLGEYEQHGDGRLDQSRVEAWRRFNKGKTSSSYLQDDE